MTRPLVVELVGPAGAGKSTLSQALTKRGRILRLSVWHVPLHTLLLSTLRLLPTLIELARHSRSLLGQEWRYLVRLHSLHYSVKQIALADARVVVLDEGPVFAFSYLHAFAEESIRGRRFEQWWREMVHQWATTLDIVISIDAPDSTLARRIREREKPHRVKEECDSQIYAFLARYRVAHERVISELTSGTGPVVLALSTSEMPADRIADKLMVALEAYPNAS